MNSQANIFFVISEDYPLLFKLVIILTIALFVTWVIRLIRKRLIPRLEKTSQIWDDSLLTAIYAPALLLVWVIALSVFLPILLTELELGLNISQAMGILRSACFIVSFLWFIMRYVHTIETHLLSRSQVNTTFMRDKTNIRFIAQMIRVTLICISLVALMQTVGVHVGTLLAFGGVGGIALTFAARDSLANFFGGMMIYLDRPFEIGDWISSPDRNIEGTVERIGWRSTCIRTFDKRPLYVPNGVFSTVSIENPQRMSHRRIKTTIGLRYQDASKIAVILSDIEAMLRSHPDIDSNQALMVNLFEFGASSLNFFIYTFTKTTKWEEFQAVQQDVFLKTIDIIAQHGAECAFPSTTLYVPDEIGVSSKS